MEGYKYVLATTKLPGKPQSSTTRHPACHGRDSAVPRRPSRDAVPPHCPAGSQVPCGPSCVGSIVTLVLAGRLDGDGKRNRTTGGTAADILFLHDSLKHKLCQFALSTSAGCHFYITTWYVCRYWLCSRLRYTNKEVRFVMRLNIFIYTIYIYILCAIISLESLALRGRWHAQGCIVKYPRVRVSAMYASDLE